MRQADINKIRDKAVASAKTVLCTEVLREAKYPMRTRGNQVYSVCYNCGDGQNIKSDKFSVNTDKNLYHCFGCGCGGGAPKLYSELHHVSYMDACLHLAVKNGDVTMEEYSAVTNTVDGEAKFQKDNFVYRKIEEKQADIVEQKAPVEVVDLVYRHMLMLPEFQLSPEGRSYLYGRNLSDQEINEIGFFEYLKPFSIDRLISSIKSEQPSFTYNHFVGVAGFFFQFANKEHSCGNWMFKAPYKDCLGIPLRDANGRITAFQMRYMGKETRNKYFYVSSKNISVKGRDVAYGSGCGSPVCVCYPDVVTNSTFCVGEGFFKMRELSKEGSVTFSVQGVNSYSYVADEVKAVLKSDMLKSRIAGLGKREIHFVICYDADMYQKIQVLEAGVKTAEYLKRQFPGKKVSFLVWNPVLGKGYDDMKYYCESNGLNYKSYLRAVSAETFIDCTKQAVRAADNRILPTYGKAADKKMRQTPEWGAALMDELYTKRISIL